MTLTWQKYHGELEQERHASRLIACENNTYAVTFGDAHKSVKKKTKKTKKTQELF